jgi:hypothetical protein
LLLSSVSQRRSQPSAMAGDYSRACGLPMLLAKLAGLSLPLPVRTGIEACDRRFQRHQPVIAA